IVTGLVGAGLLAILGRFDGAAGAASTAVIACMMFMYSPGVQRRDQINHDFTAFAPAVWNAVGHGLFMYMADETLAPTLSFFGDREVRRTGPRTILPALENADVYCLVGDRAWPSVESMPEIRAHCAIVFHKQTAKEGYVLI